MNNLVRGLERVRRGLTEADWAAVSEGYFLVTGERVVANPPGLAEVERLKGEILSHLRSLEELVGGREAEVAPAPAPAPPPKPRAKPRPKSKKVVDPRVEVMDFTVQHGETAPGRVPADQEGFVNTFTDDGSVPPDPLDRAVVKRTKPPPRPPYKFVPVVCGACGRQESVHPTLAPRKLDGGDTKSIYLCDGCARRG